MHGRTGWNVFARCGLLFAGKKPFVFFELFKCCPRCSPCFKKVVYPPANPTKGEVVNTVRSDSNNRRFGYLSRLNFPVNGGNEEFAQYLQMRGGRD